ncbi:hypothetical protein [Alphaproteobacteria bacterium endosymbiont of Tiliacea citrago]|uniref:hypothetical protein n=1 Tax=Alphaproteobacteria bacterium endosymbiont of Tiliacea citrago TaxID=3077944 RepID=UPI00313EB588
MRKREERIKQMSSEEIETQQEINRKSLKRAKEEMKKVKELLNQQNAKKQLLN